MSNGLAEFLEARIAEDEADARLAAQGFSTSEWTLDGGIYAGHESDEVVDWAYQETRQHIARWDPSRVLAECQARRQILEIHRSMTSPYVEYPHCAMCVNEAGWPLTSHKPLIGNLFPCTTLRTLAMPYSHHPEYQSGWAPEVMSHG